MKLVLSLRQDFSLHSKIVISRSVALPRNAVGEAPPHDQQHVCHVPLVLSILSKLCFE